MKISDKFEFFNESDVNAVSNVLRGKKLSGTSKVVLDYEDKLSEFFKSQYAVASSSGTAVIQVALFSLGVKKGDEVIVSSVCPSMSIVSIIALGAKPIFCDTSPNSFGLDINDLKKIINSKTKAVIEVPMWGYPTDVIKLKNFLSKYNIPLLLDLAQAHGTKLNGEYLSNFGDISCFSTHDRKILPTGEGGFALTNNQKYYDLMQSYTKFGNMNGKDFGLNFKLGSLQAGLGINRLNFVNDQLSTRSKNANYILSRIKNEKIQEFEITKHGLPNYYTLLMKVKKGSCSDFIEYLDKNNIPSDIKRYNFKVLYKYPLFKKYKRICKNSEKLSHEITTIPVHPGLGRTELDYIIEVINNY